ncbi:uncharacterized protein LOC135178107 isoform X2 [Pogoniulus pusillus]|uniref:uncharacterized protein LOC135178107 isoform X2 n=1 Tax=Pogoniulus pusillus TaxID=488313 RepID=UPI0030B97505
MNNIQVQPEEIVWYSQKYFPVSTFCTYMVSDTSCINTKKICLVFNPREVSKSCPLRRLAKSPVLPRMHDTRLQQSAAWSYRSVVSVSPLKRIGRRTRSARQEHPPSTMARRAPVPVSPPRLRLLRRQQGGRGPPAGEARPSADPPSSPNFPRFSPRLAPAYCRGRAASRPSQAGGAAQCRDPR